MACDPFLASDFVEDAKRLLGGRLVSVVLFGSEARGTSGRGSDADFLVVGEGLPERLIERGRLFSEIRVRYLRERGVRPSVVCVSPRDLEGGVSPLIYGLLTGYRILYDRGGFFSGYLASLKPLVSARRPVYSEGGKKWKIAEII